MLTANIAGVGRCELEWRDGLITGIRRVGSEDPAEPYCSAGFVDLQINGMAGVDFGSAQLTAQDVIAVLPRMWESGVTAFCPTVITNTQEGLSRSFRVLEEARRLSPEFDQCAPCYHLEGPFLSSGESHGAHNPAWMRDPSDQEFADLQDAAGGHIGLVTLAPERAGAIEFIARWSAKGVIFSIGHTDAGAADIHQAATAGARLSTHLGNGCPERIHRHRSPVWAQLACDRLNASLICDGFHVTPEFSRVVYGLKGRSATILITDAIHVAGLEPGAYELGGLPVELESNGRVVSLRNPGALAGSTLRMNQAVARFRDMASVPLEVALDAATRNPARLIGRTGVLEPGQPADLVLFRAAPAELRILATYLKGRRVTP
jgi:N-acetylglucosamine-6-phosphate deacetylase